MKDQATAKVDEAKDKANDVAADAKEKGKASISSSEEVSIRFL